jgi:hypothetical protein
MNECEIMEIHKKNLLKGVKTCKLDFYRYWVLEKHNKMQFKTATHKTKEIIDYVHTDVWGSVRLASRGG